MGAKSRNIVALDIGTGERGSGWVCFDTKADEHNPVNADNTRVVWSVMESNEEILRQLRAGSAPVQFVFEGVSSYGKAIGAETIGTALKIGEMIGTIETRRRELGDPDPVIVLRRVVAAHLVGARKKGQPTMDSMIAAAVRERFGGMGASRSDVCGTKKNPGPLYGFKQDIWQAAGLAVAYIEGCQVEERR